MIFDASSIYRVIEANALEKILEEKTIDLALYELGNVVWKAVIRDKISLDEGLKLVEFISEAISLMKIQKDGIKNEVLKLAVKKNLSYYDASYLYASISQKEILVTEDKKLLNCALRNGVNARSFEEI